MPKRKASGCLGIIATGAILYSVIIALLTSSENVKTSAMQIGEIREAIALERAGAAPTLTGTLATPAGAGDFAEVAELAEMKSINGWGVVTAPVLNQRTEPTTEAAIVGTLAAGVCVQLIGERDGWYRTSIEGSESWSSAEFIAPVDACPASEPASMP